MGDQLHLVRKVSHGQPERISLTSTNCSVNERFRSTEHIFGHDVPPLVPHLDQLVFEEIEVRALISTTSAFVAVDSPKQREAKAVRFFA
jgi:hypothetical protein